MYHKIFIPSVAIFAILVIVIVAVPAHADEASHVRIVRLSFVEGDVAYQRPGTAWQRAMVNLPIQQDFSLRTDAGYAEVEFETGLVMRFAQDTHVEFTELSLMDGRKVTAVKLDQGTVIATANLSHDDQLSIATGNLDVTVPRSGRFRVDASASENWVTVFHGRVEVANGSSTTGLESGKSLHFGGAENTASIDRDSKPDAFDKWVSQRDQAQESAQSDAGEFVAQRNYAYTVSDLYDYGLWFNMPGYGMVWQPYGLGSGWMPFDSGQWMLGDASVGWMWMSFEPWGWLPYHYGGWVNVAGGGWFWVPQNLGVFQAATANFVNVGSQVGWTPTMATPTNPGKVTARPVAPIQVVFAGNASNGVIVPGPRGQLSSAALKTASSPSASFVQLGAPTAATLVASGVTVTGHAPVGPVSTVLGYTGHGIVGAKNGAQVNLNAQGGRPTTLAPRSAAVPVVRAPSTFVSLYPGGRSFGFTPANSNAGTSTGMVSHVPASASVTSAHTAGAGSSAPAKH